jgi:hypothetical protein
MICGSCGVDHPVPRDNTRLGHELAILEGQDPEVLAAGERLDQTMKDIASGYTADRDRMIQEIYD